MDTVALYLRKSRDESHEYREDTLARHEKMLLEYCARNNLIIKDIFKEIVSGESIANRPEMQKLLDNVSSNMYDGVVCIEIERLSRGNQIDQCEIVEIMKKSNTKIYTLTKVYDLKKEEFDEEFFEFSLFMSRREYKVINRRLARGRAMSTKEGYYIGSVLPYGFSKVRGDKGFILVPDKVEAKLIKTIFNKYLAGEGVTAIAHYLNDKGIKPKIAPQWSDHIIRAILTNKVYIGLIHSKNLNTWVEGKHDPLIDLELFERVQEKIKHGTKCKSDRALANPFASLMYCAECGYTINRAKNERGLELLRCKTLNCPTKGTKLQTVEDQVLKELREELQGFNYFIDNFEAELENKRIAQAKELELLNQELEKKTAMIDTACEMLEQGIYSKELFNKRVKILESDIESINSKIHHIETTPVLEDLRAKTAIPILEKVLRDYPKLTPKEKNLLLKRIVKRIDYTRTGEDIELSISLLI